jgi:hypothetical protein
MAHARVVAHLFGGDEAAYDPATVRSVLQNSFGVFVSQGTDPDPEYACRVAAPAECPAVGEVKVESVIVTLSQEVLDEEELLQKSPLDHFAAVLEHQLKQEPALLQCPEYDRTLPAQRNWWVAHLFLQKQHELLDQLKREQQSQRNQLRLEHHQADLAELRALAQR